MVTISFPLPDRRILKVPNKGTQSQVPRWWQGEGVRPPSWMALPHSWLAPSALTHKASSWTWAKPGHPASWAVDLNWRHPPIPEASTASPHSSPKPVRTQETTRTPNQEARFRLLSYFQRHSLYQSFFKNKLPFGFCSLGFSITLGQQPARHPPNAFPVPKLTFSRIHDSGPAIKMQIGTGLCT